LRKSRRLIPLSIRLSGKLLLTMISPLFKYALFDLG
jgi:hypothetical protein